MSYENYLHLIECMRHPHLSVRSSLIGIRRICRHVIAQSAIYKDRYKTEIAACSKGLPFTSARHTALVESRDGLRADARAVLLKMGRSVVDLDSHARQHLTFQQVAEIFCVNRAHWDEAKTHYDDRGLLGLLWVGKLEDSATYLPLADKAGFWFDMGPTVEAVNLYMTQWMARNINKCPSPFAPGGPFYGVPTYTQQPDGSMQRNAPDLVVHNSDGSSAVVSRKDGR